MFFLPALSMGTVSPVVAKLAVGRLRRFHRTGSAIGQVYAWGMVGSIIGTFLTGFVLIDYLGTKGVLLALGTVLALGATFLGELFHAVWAGIPLGLCVIAFTPPGWVDVFSRVIPSINGQSFAKMGQEWGVREPVGDPTTTAEDYAWIDESDYYYIKIENEPEEGGEIQRRTLVLDNLIHGYFILNHPERLDYDYEHIYALVAYRAAKTGGQVKFKPVADEGPVGEAPTGAGMKPSGSPPSPGVAEPAAKDSSPSEKKDSSPSEPSTEPAKADGGAAKPSEPPPTGKDSAPKPGPGFFSVAPTIQDGKAPADTTKKATADQESKPAPEAPQSDSSKAPAKAEESGSQQKSDAAPAPKLFQEQIPTEKSGASPAKNDSGEKKVPADFKELKEIFDLEKALSGDSNRKEPYIPHVESSTLKTLFLGGGAYCFQRHMQFAYPGTGVDVAEIDPAVKRANLMATGLPPDTKIETYLGDARQFVELHQDTKKYDLIFGDAFNDFSVPWHLTTKEFNDKLKKMMTPDGVYMINIIDVYMSDSEAKRRADKEIEEKEIKGEAEKEAIRVKYDQRARRYGGFVGAWTRTAMLTFGKDNVYIFGTDDPGEGRRETFVVVASMKPLDLKDLGLRKDDPRYFTPRGRHSTPKPYGEADFNAVVNDRSKGIVLTDDYAPVENLLAPVAETRGEGDD